MAESAVQHGVAAECADADRGFWLDLRSKQDICETDLDAQTCAPYIYHDPLLTPTVGGVSVAPGFDWECVPPSRSWQLNLHSFRFADYWILDYQRSGDGAILSRLEEVLVDYAERVWSARPMPIPNVVCSDVSVAQRAAVIAFLLGRHEAGAYESQAPWRLASLLAEHVAWAADDAHYNSNNHGLFNDTHLLIAAVNAPKQGCVQAVVRAVSDRLLATFLELQVNREGVHLEHTPAYALLWVLLGRKLSAVVRRIPEMIPDAAEAITRLETGIARVLSTMWWFLKPDGSLVSLGDQGRTPTPAWISRLQGAPGLAHFRESGYGFYKDGGSYAGLVAAYHATKRDRTGYRSASHKRRDELQVVWCESAGEILVDTGLRGYDFGAERRYTFSKQAHNTLSIGSEDFLTGSIADYMGATEPYGGAVHLVAECSLGSGWVCLAGNDPLLAKRQIEHWRLVLLEPGKWLVFCDFVALRKGAKAEWNFHFAQQWRCMSHGADGAMLATDDWGVRLSRYAATPVSSAKAHLHRGDFDPLRGWRFAGDPIAISNLRFIEWLPSGRAHLRVTALSLSRRGSTGGRLESVEIEGGDSTAFLRLKLSESGHERVVRIGLETPSELAVLMRRAVRAGAGPQD